MKNASGVRWLPGEMCACAVRTRRGASPSRQSHGGLAHERLHAGDAYGRPRHSAIGKRSRRRLARANLFFIFSYSEVLPNIRITIQNSSFRDRA